MLLCRRLVLRPVAVVWQQPMREYMLNKIRLHWSSFTDSIQCLRLNDLNCGGEHEDLALPNTRAQLRTITHTHTRALPFVYFPQVYSGKLHHHRVTPDLTRFAEVMSNSK